jgi:hypothetical protein
MRLAEFVDGELDGVERLAVARHLTVCQACAGEIETLREIGQALREPVATEATRELDGLAGGVVTRFRAERSISWRAMLDRAVDGWHWVLVGGGSLGAASATTVFLACLLHFGPAPVRDDSMAGMLSMLSADRPQVFSSGEGALYITPVTSPASAFTGDLAAAYLAELIAPDGRMRDPGAMSKRDLQLIADLANQIKKADAWRPAFPRMSSLPAVELRFVTTADVSAKGL